MPGSAIVNILFCGIGGQGVLSAAEICSLAAMFSGMHVKKSEVHGMAQRGGSVESHVRFGRYVYSPLITEAGADYLVPFFAAEHGRLKHFLKKGGTDLLPALKKAQEDIAGRRFMNTYLLGVLSARLDIAEYSWMKALEEVLGNKSIAENKKIFLQARSLASEK